MKTFRKTFPITVSFFFILLFVYAAASKMIDFENFQVQLAQSPLLSAYAGMISYGVIALEIGIAVLLFVPKWRNLGMHTAFGLMVAFTVYIYLILHHSDDIPCSCGGILEKMGWPEHLIFNVACVGISLFAIVFIGKEGAVHFRRTAAVSSLIVMISGGGMGALFLSSEYIMKKENNFTRRFPFQPIILDQSFDLEVNSYYFAGSDDQHIYFGNPTAPFQLFTLDHSFKKLETVTIQTDPDLQFRSPKVKVSNDQLFFFDGTVPIIYAGNQKDFSGKVKTKSFRNVYFEQLAIIDSNHFYFTAVSSSTQDKVLGSLQINETPSVQLRGDILKKKHDGIFDTDGLLLTDKKNSGVFYVHYYSNRIIKLDLNKTKQTSMRTIDPISTPDIPVTKLEDGRRKMTVPPPTVNRSMAVYGGVLFCESPRMGKFEERSLWKDHFIIDVYKTYSAEYWGSFYIPKGREKTLRMLATDQYLFVLSGTKIIRYRWNKSVKDSFQ
ncbi:MauE/DoxX family redox-associated membrane protein [Chryseobacterium salivictor]|uniref:Methylamine utilisation protein MauE domain-containing protein n=1 Tax=Chryseobacterium salivictor TaxID=2547600 RepID=A0A4P6ZI98_9FLAO|nr:MauE/DoxX family redox-associated membrane protein [Chryseobacterium salivictor]QBO59342.1 hypothetical protein NBC122_02538 [Chryseobacterium salivictor]